MPLPGSLIRGLCISINGDLCLEVVNRFYLLRHPDTGLRTAYSGNIVLTFHNIYFLSSPQAFVLHGHFLSKRFLGDTHSVMSLIVFGIVLVSASDLCSGVLFLTKP